MPLTLTGNSWRPSHRLLATLMLLLAMLTLALMPRHAGAEEDFLAPEKAFRFSASAVAPDTVELSWNIAPKYYMYREQFHFVTDPPRIALGEPQIPPGKIKFDTTFNKDVETYRDLVSVRIAVPAGAPPFTLVATGQGCADAGLCYPPTEYRTHVTPATGSAAITVRDAASGFSWNDLLHSDDVGLADMLAGGSLLQTVLVFLGLGVLLSLTPCVLPMVPILSAILVGDTAKSAHPRLRGLGLAAVYVAGMSLVYTVVGILAGLSGESLAASLQTPWVLGAFAALLAILALAMFDVFTLQLPASWQSSLSARAASLPGGRAAGAFAMGAISALIVGPCVAAPLAGALLYISQTRDVLLGALALFALAWGMGVPLLVAGASAGALLPKTGAWMNGVKRFFGMLLLGVAWWMLWPVLSGAVQMIGWAVLAILTAALLRAFDGLPPGAGLAQRFLKALGLMFALVGVLQAVGVASGGHDPLLPLAHLARADGANPARVAFPAVGGVAPGESAYAPATASARGIVGDAPAMNEAPDKAAPGAWMREASQPATASSGGGFTRIRTVAELDALAAASDHPVMLDFYADWCVSCKEMEALTFPKPAVRERLAQMRLVQVDVTANNADDRELLKRFKLFGPPGIVFFAPGGKVLTGIRVIGFQGAERFAGTLDKVLATTSR